MYNPQNDSYLVDLWLYLALRKRFNLGGFRGIFHWATELALCVIKQTDCFLFFPLDADKNLSGLFGRALMPVAQGIEGEHPQGGNLALLKSLCSVDSLPVSCFRALTYPSTTGDLVTLQQLLPNVFQWVLSIIRKTSTSKLYALKWQLYVSWC